MRRMLRPGIQGILPGYGQGGIRQHGSGWTKNHFTVTITADVSRTSLKVGASFKDTLQEGTVQ